ncbi:helicase-related protein [Actinobacillus delphinicola]|uniref:ATP-dependent helicase n=1 Tax=Actinobacillus delphinicola TaxID=51161 RepID=A0A448TVL9_9PAST|nr:helicase-related protein [Actinobacillus delphinicola]VEJ09986.1 ATP-dependent helicase [Actinobacillus delphinicola]
MIQLIDNINKLLGEDIKQNLNEHSKLKIAASYFSIYAFAALKEELEKLDSVQFIFTSPTFINNQIADNLKKEKREFIIPQHERENGIYGTEFEIHLKNKLIQKAIAKECAAWIRRKASFQSNIDESVMQEMICIQNSDSITAYSPIQGFTPVGLGYKKGNALSNLVNCLNSPLSNQYMQLFDQIWADTSKVKDITSEIISHIESVYQENAPEKIYFLFLYNIFKEFLENIGEDVMPNNLTGYQDTLVWQKLYSFQKDAAVGIINKLETYNGCILADSVGLGKTFTALAVIKYYELRNKSVLVLCPKKLGENWTNYNTNLVTNIFASDRFNYDVLYHTDLSRDSGHTLGIDLAKINWGNYDLVVIDESHNFRNNDAFKDKQTRYERLMEKVMRQGVKTKVLMLSATPVNNRFNDLKNQLALAYEGNTAEINEKLDTNKDIDTIFKSAQTQFNTWAKLPLAQRTTQKILNLLDFDFFKLLDSVTIARSRKHIQKFYNTTDIGSFPERLKPISFRCGISEDNIITLNDIYASLSALNLSVYAPFSFIFPSKIQKYEDLFDTKTKDGGRLKQKDREKSLQSLMTVNLLKRLESSIHSFRLTLQTLYNRIQDMLNQIERFENNDTDTNIDINLEYNEDDNDPNEWIGEKLKINLNDVDIVLWKQELSADNEIISNLLARIKPITPQKDHKLQHIKKHIIDKINNPINSNNKKIIIFTAFADTADYLFNNLADELLVELGIHTAKITGTNNTATIKSRPNSRQYYDMQGLLTLFSPRSKSKNQIFPDEQREVDLLIATDCISEGQNLQDCDYLINYDIHWNPVRIIQRFGRIDRIGSQNKYIQLVNYWPNISLDSYINLRERVENRMVLVDISSTGDENVLSAKSNDIAYRHEQLRRLQNEVLDIEDANTGVSITDLGLNDFRMDLLNYIEHHPEIKSLPKGLHAVVPANNDIGLIPGAIFVLKSRETLHQKNIVNQLHPYYLTYVTEDGKIVLDYTQTKHLLEIVKKACYKKDKPIPSAYERFNARTCDGRDMQHYSQLLDTVIRSIKAVKEDKDIDSLFTGVTTTALNNQISTLNDFELIGFIVIEHP